MKALQVALSHPKVGAGVLTFASINPTALVAVGLGCAVVGATVGVMLYRLELEKSRSQHQSRG